MSGQVYSGKANYTFEPCLRCSDVLVCLRKCSTAGVASCAYQLGVEQTEFVAGKSSSRHLWMGHATCFESSHDRLPATCFGSV
jgi:hypothetical protein